MSQAQRRGRRRSRQQPEQPPESEAHASEVGPLLLADSTSTTTAPRAAGRSGRRALLVIAHPDDETMFFTPAIADLQRRGCELFLLCCSTGNFYGEGDIRRGEMVAAAELLGIRADRVQVLDHPELQDGPNNPWPPVLLGRFIGEAVEHHGIDEILTFDVGGVSGHPNHGALAHAMAHLPAAAAAAGRKPKVWLLETTSLLRKYIGIVDVLVSLLLAWARSLWGSGGTWVALNSRPWLAYRAMLAHASQFVWYRRLFILFSRYTYVNTLVRDDPQPQQGAGAGAGAKAAAGRGRDRRKSKSG